MKTESLNICLSRKSVQRNDKGQELMLEQHLFLRERKQKRFRGCKSEKVRGLGEQRCFTEVKENDL